MAKGRAASVECETTLTAKGQVTIPAPIREKLGVRPGDKLRFRVAASGAVTIEARTQRSIFEQLAKLELPAIGRLATDADIDEAVGEAMSAQERRSLQNRR